MYSNIYNTYILCIVIYIWDLRNHHGLMVILWTYHWIYFLEMSTNWIHEMP